MKMNKLLFALSFVVMLGVGVCSCGGGDDNTTESSKGREDGKGGDDDGGQDNTPMSKAEQTTLLESTAREFIAMAPPSDFEDLTAMFNEAKKISSRSVGDWANDIFEKTVESISDELINSYSSDNYVSYSYERHFKAAFEIANYKGHFEVSNGKWVLVESNVDDLMFTFKDSNNDAWVLRFEATGTFKKVHMFDLHNRNYEYSYSDSKSVYKSYDDYKNCIIAVPKVLNVSLTKNNTKMLNTAFNAELSDITDDEFDISKNDISCSVVVDVKNYKINVSQIVYKHNNSATVNLSVAKGDKQMMSVAVSSELSGIPSVNVSAFSHHLNSNDWEYSDGKAFVKIDILGKVQIQGEATKIHTIVDKLEAARKNKESESEFKSNIKDANEYLNLGLYYNNKSLKQATAYLEPFEKTGYRYSYPDGYKSYKYWGWDAVIKFGDESTYSTMANYFSKSNFRSVYGDVESLLESYSKLIKK